jgi:hypothetical protein
LNNKEEFRQSDPKKRKQVLEKKKHTLSSVSDCIGDVFSVAIPILGEYIDCGGRKRKKRKGKTQGKRSKTPRDDDDEDSDERVEEEEDSNLSE